MEGDISMEQTNHPGLDENFFRDVIEATRKDPKKRIALFANNLTDPAYEGKVMKSILCIRGCCKVVSQGGKNKSNIELINEYLCNDDADSRKNAADIIRNILTKKNVNAVFRSCSFMGDLPSLLEAIVKNEFLKDEAKGIIRNIFSKGNMKNKDLLAHLSRLLEAMVQNESLKDEARDIIKNIFSKENIGAVLENETFVREFPSLLEAMVKNESLRDEAKDIIRNIFSKENMKDKELLDHLLSLLKAMVENKSLRDEAMGTIENIFSKENMKNKELLDHLLSLLKDMIENESLRDEAMGTIRNIFLKEGNIGTVLKSEAFMNSLLRLLKDMFENGSLKDKARDIIRSIFSEKNIGTVLKSEAFMENLSSLLKAMIENKSFKNDVKYIIKNMFLSNMSSNKNLGEVLKDVDSRLGRPESATGNIIKGLAKEMLKKEYKDFENKEPNNIVKNLISSKNIMPELSSSSAQKEMLNRENSSVRDGISSLKSVMHMFDSSSMFEEMSDYRNKTEDSRNKTEDSASDFIRKILENDSVPEQLKSDLKALKDDFSAKRKEVPFDALIKKEEKARNKKLSVFQREE